MELLGVFVGLCGCIVLAAMALYCLSQFNDGRRWWALFWIALLPAPAYPLLSFLPPPFASVDSLSGIYQSPKCTLVLHPDGRFDQRLEGGRKVYLTTGTWSLDGGKVVLDDAYSYDEGLFDVESGQVRKGSVTANARWLQNALVVGEDSNAQLERISLVDDTPWRRTAH